MPQQPPVFDPNEFANNTPVFDPNEFGQKPAEPNWYDTAASYIPSPVKSAWNTLWEPMSDLPSRVMKPLAEAQYKYGESGSGLLNRLAMYGGAFDEAIGNTLSGMTSPGVIGTTLATGGTGLAARAGLPRVAQALAGAERVGGGLMAAQGATEVANPNASLMERGLGAINMVGGGLAARGARVPKGAGALEELPVKQSAAPIEVTPEAMPVRPPGKPLVESIQEMGLPPEQELAAYKGIIERNTPSKFEPLPINEGESIGDYIKRNGIESIYTTPEEAMANRAKAAPIEPQIPVEAGYTPEAQRAQMMELTKEGMPTTKEGMAARLEQERRVTQGESPTGVERRVAGETSDVQEPQPTFDPNTLQGLEKTPTPELEFLNPVTHEIRPASQAEPGDIPLPPAKEPTPINMLPPEANAEAPMPVRRAGGRMNAPNLGLSKPPAAERGIANETPREYFAGKPKISTGEINPANVKPETTRVYRGGQAYEVPTEHLRPAEEVTKTLRNKLTKTSSETPGAPRVIAGKEPKSSMYGPIKRPQHRVPSLTERPAPKPLPEQSMASQIWNTPRSLQSVDLPGVTSAALRQSRPLAFTRDWFKAWNSAARAFGSEEALAQIHAKIKSSEYFKPRYEAVRNKAGETIRYREIPSIAEELGVKMTDILNRREEAIASSLAERIPGYGRYVKASNRAYTAFLNDLRAAKFRDLMEGAKAAGRDAEVDTVLGKKLASFVNNATGRGSLGAAEGTKVAELLGDTLYSPRALSARLQMLNPQNWLLEDKMVRTEYIKGLARMGVSWGAFSALASFMPGVHVSMDPNNADFGKIRIGNTRIDPGAGFQQLLVLTHRELPQILGGGGTVSSTGPAGQPGRFTPFGKTPMSSNRWTLPMKYLYNQMNPSLRFVADMLQATKKEPVDLTDRTLQLALPMYVTDIADAAKDDNYTAEFFAPLLSSMGTGVQTYERGSFNKPVITPFTKKLTGIDLPTTLIGR